MKAWPRPEIQNVIHSVFRTTLRTWTAALKPSSFALGAPALGLFAAALATPSLALAASEQATLSIGGQVFYATSQSGLAESNDTGLMSSYGLNVFAGERKNLSVHLEGAQASFAYALNSASWSSSELCFLLRAYYGPVYVGALGGTTQVLLKRADGSQADAFATLYGGLAGVRFEFGRDTVVTADMRAVLPTGIKEANQQDFSLGLKVQGKAGLTFDLTRKLLDLDLGVLYSTQEASFQGTGKGEVITAPFVGLSMNTDF